jgi:hypothetical protein
MDPLAAISSPTAQVQNFPAEWITSGVVTPVDGSAPAPSVASPAAAVATAWVPQPAPVAVDQGTGSLLDAIAASIMGPLPSSIPAMPVEAIAAQQQLQQQQLQQLPATASVVSPVAAGVSTQLPPTATGDDPSRIASVGTAIAGFASATGRAVANVAGAGASTARKVGTEVWAGVRNPRSIHVSQVPSKYNAAPAANNKDCGPASVVMTLRLLGKSIPGVASNAAPQKLINRVRQLTGNAVNSVSTTNVQLERALRSAGTRVTEIATAAAVRQSVLAGKPVILNGNPRNPGAYGPSFSSSQMTPYNGAHWIVVSGFDSKAGKFIINDPLSKVGPVKVSPAQLEAYRGGSMGIEVEG